METLQKSPSREGLRARKSLVWLSKKNLVAKRRDPSDGLYFKATPDGLAILAEYKKIAEKLF